MPAVVKTPEQERLWRKAKAQADKQGRAGDHAYVMGIFKQMGGMEKSFTVAAPFRRFTIPGQVPNREAIEALRLATAKPPRFHPMMLLDQSTRPCFTPQRVVDGLGMSRAQEKSWARHIERAVAGSTNELVMRQDVMSKMLEERMEPELRRVLFQRTMSYWRGRLQKSVAVVRPDDLLKAHPHGGKYHKRVPKPGGGYRYFYDEEKYKTHAAAHVSGKEAMETAITNGINGHVKKAGQDGCALGELKPLVKRYGPKAVGGVLNRACGDGGSLRFKKGKLFAKSERFVLRRV